MLAIVFAFAGCAIDRPADVRNPRPLVIYAVGAGGVSPMDHAFLAGITKGGLDAEVRAFNWTKYPLLMDTNMNAVDHNAARSATLAGEIDHAVRIDRRPVVLVSQSAGAGIIVEALKRLDDGVQVDGAIMLAPAVSPQYDLSGALRHIRHSLYVFYSPKDSFYLGWGTETFGTMDQVKTAAAGRDGFAPPTGADVRQYGKLVHIPHDPQWGSKYVNFGSHNGAINARFSSGVITPLIIRLIDEPPPDSREERSPSHGTEADASTTTPEAGNPPTCQMEAHGATSP